MNARSPFRFRFVAFTLIELLTVITIIAILMGLLFPVLSVFRDRARTAQARNDVLNIVVAVNHYSTDYGKYPPVTQAGAGAASQAGSAQDEFVGDPAAGAKEVNSKLFNTLRAIPEEPNTDHKLNSRRVVYFEGKSVSDPDSPRGGFLDRAGGKSSADKGSYYDPWGKQYNIVLDTNYDNVLDVNQVYTDFSQNDKPRTPAGAFSLGKDNKPGENGNARYRSGTKVADNVISWQ